MYQFEDPKSTVVARLKVEACKDALYTGEYAGAGEIWQLDEATIDITEPTGGDDNYWFLGRRPGTRTDSWFQNRIGACYGSDNRDRTPKRGTVSVQFDSFTAGRMAQAGKFTFLPDSGWEVKQIGHYSSGKPMYRAVRIKS